DAGSTDLVVSAVTTSSSIVLTTPTGYTSVLNTSSVATAYRVNASALTDSAAWTLGTAGVGTVVTAAFGSSQPTAPHVVDAFPVPAVGGAGAISISGAIYNAVAGDAVLASVWASNPNSAAP